MFQPCFRMAAIAVLVAACAANAQFTTVPTREAMNANDSLTWNQLGSAGQVIFPPYVATSARGLKVTSSGGGGSATLLVAGDGTDFSQLPRGFAPGDVYVLTLQPGLFAMRFERPVVAAGFQVVLDGPAPQVAFYTGSAVAYNGDTKLGAANFSGDFDATKPNLAPFVGVRDERGITRIEIFAGVCFFPGCLKFAVNQLSLLTPEQVSVDVKPGDDKNVIVTRSSAKLPFVIFPSAGLNTATQLDVASLTFGRTGDEASILSCVGGADANGDSLPDLSCQFSVRSAAFQPGDLTAQFKGKTTSGIPVFGTANILAK